MPNADGRGRATVDRPATLDPDGDRGSARVRAWLVDVTVGGLIGGLVGAVAAVNLVIYAGVDQGYEASLGEVFQHNLIVGIVTVMILVAGPVVGVLVARRSRRNRSRHGISRRR